MKTFTPTSAEFFEQKYRFESDPWQFETSEYERYRYTRILGALGSRHFNNAVEPGCSIGVLTEGLSRSCDRLYAFDLSATAVARCRSRCLHLRHVVVECRSLDLSLQVEPMDLLVLSEIGYYFTSQQWERMVDHLISQVLPGGTVLAAHWLGISEDHQISGDEVHRMLLLHRSLELEYSERFERFRLDRLVRKG